MAHVYTHQCVFYLAQFYDMGHFQYIFHNPQMVANELLHTVLCIVVQCVTLDCSMH